jgi:hypothetical protein
MEDKNTKKEKKQPKEKKEKKQKEKKEKKTKKDKKSSPTTVEEAIEKCIENKSEILMLDSDSLLQEEELDGSLFSKLGHVREVRKKKLFDSVIF